MQKKDDDEDIEATRDLNQTKWTYFFQHILAHPVNMTHTVLQMTHSDQKDGPVSRPDSCFGPGMKICF